MLYAAPFSRPADDLDTGAIAAALRQRLHRAPVLSRRIVWSRLGDGRPAWAEDPAFDPARHISTVRLPPGADLFDWCAGRAARPLDLARPPWRIEIVDGLPGPSFGLLVVVHHVLDVLADGLTGMAIAASLLDASPDARAGQVPPRPGSTLPGHRDLVGDKPLAQASAIGRAAHQIPSSIICRTTARLKTRHAAGSGEGLGVLHLAVLTVSINSDAAAGDLAPLVSGMHDALSTLQPNAILDPPVTE